MIVAVLTGKINKTSFHLNMQEVYLLFSEYIKHWLSAPKVHMDPIPDKQV